MTTNGSVVDLPTAGAVLSTAAVAAGFEIGMLLRCARTGSGRHGSSAASSPIEFSRPGAAERLVRLLTGLGIDARQVEYAAGMRHRYTVYRVVCPDLDTAALARAWCVGYRRLCAPEQYRTRRQRRERAALAAAAWRAAVLAGGLRGCRGPLAIRVTHVDLVMVLVRAARILNVNVGLRTTSGCHLVEVTDKPADLALRGLATQALAS